MCMNFSVFCRSNRTVGTSLTALLSVYGRSDSLGAECDMKWPFMFSPPVTVPSLTHWTRDLGGDEAAPQKCQDWLKKCEQDRWSCLCFTQEVRAFLAQTGCSSEPTRLDFLFFFTVFLPPKCALSMKWITKKHCNQCLTPRRNIRSSQKHKYILESGHVNTNAHFAVTTYPQGSLLKSGVKCRVSRVLSDPSGFSRADLNSRCILCEVKECRSSLALSRDSSYWTKSAAFTDCQNFESWIVFAVFYFLSWEDLEQKQLVSKQTGHRKHLEDVPYIR